MAPQMWLLVCVLALLLSGVEAANITIRAVDTNAHAKSGVQWLGIGYNLLKAGFIMRPGRRVLDVDLGLMKFNTHYDCLSSFIPAYIYDKKSFQENLDPIVDMKGGVTAKLMEARFTLSSDFLYLTENAQTIIMMETPNSCGYSLAFLEKESWKASQGFQAAVCQLPDTYDQAAYVKFIDDWGTNFVVDVSVGSRDLIEKTASFSSVYQTLQRKTGNSGGTFDHHDAIASVNGSIEIDMNKLKESQVLKEAFSDTKSIQRIGSEEIPEPTKVTLGTIDSLVNATYFTAPNPPACTEAVLSKLTTKKANLAKALDEYPAAKQTMHMASSSDGKVRIPLRWPDGNYGLLKPKGPCPAGWADKGQRTWDCENDADSLVWATPGNHIDGSFTKKIQLKFCMKTTMWTDNPNAWYWPLGEYCFFQYRTCPPGFERGYVYWDDENSNNGNTYTPPLPDGVYDGDTLMHFCCRTDGYNTVPIFLPTDTPFYLMQADEYGCQEVSGMNVTSEEIQWDDENSNNADKGTGAIPFHKGDGNWRLYFCYYTKA